MNEPISIAALCLSIATLVLLVPLYGKMFFSTHTREYMPLEEYIKTRKELGLEPQDELDEAQAKAEELTDKLFNVPKEDFKPLSYLQPKQRKPVKKG
jgi:hypothetical protein